MDSLVNEQSNYFIVSLVGRLDFSTTQEFEELLKKNIFKTASSHKNVIIDLDKLEYVSSTGIRSFLNLHNQLKERRCQLILCNLQDSIIDLLKILELINFFSITKRLEDAISKLD